MQTELQNKLFENLILLLIQAGDIIKGESKNNIFTEFMDNCNPEEKVAIVELIKQTAISIIYSFQEVLEEDINGYNSKFNNRYIC